MRLLIGLALGVAVWCQSVGACNPDPPLPPILEGHEYDAVAREYLSRDATTIAIGSYVGKLDFVMEGEPGSGDKQPDYVFDLYQGWKSVPPARLVVPGYWISCQLALSPGGSYLFFLDGRTPLFILPAEPPLAELEGFGNLDWFYLPSGQLILPEMVEGVGENLGGNEAGR